MKTISIIIVLFFLTVLISCKKNEINTNTEPVEPEATNKVIFVGGDEKMYSLDAGSGKMLWESKVVFDRFTNPCYHNGILYSAPNTLFLPNYFSGYDASDGRQKFLHHGENGNSGLIGQDNVIYSFFGKKIYANDAVTGQNIWIKEVSLLENDILRIIAVNKSGIIFSDNRTMVCLNINGKDVKWIYQTTSSTIIVNNPIVINNEIIFGIRSSLIVLDRETGKVNWTQENEKSWIFRIGASNGIVYLLKSNDGQYLKMEALTINDGRMIWENSKIPGLSFGMKPVILEDKIIVSHLDGNNQEGNLSAYNLKDGGLLWTTKTKNTYMNNSFYSQGVLVTSDFASSDQKKFYFTDVNTGKLLYQQPIHELGSPYPLVANGVFFIIQHDTKDLIAYDIKTGNKIWTFNINTPISASILLDSNGKIHKSEKLSNSIANFQ